jgi:hypothetical protein
MCTPSLLSLEFPLDERRSLCCYHGSPRSFDDVIAATVMVGGHTDIHPNEQLWGVQMLTPTDGWAVGGGGPTVGVPGATSILLHYDGSSWAAVPVPKVDAITSLDMVSAHDGWATGTDTILHYDGTKWSIFAHLQSITGV